MTHQTRSSPLLDAQIAASAFFERWVTAWNHHDAKKLASLHTDDAVTVNRYGTLLLGRAEAERALTFLRSPLGPFGEFVFPPMNIAAVRQIANNVMIAQARWNAPALGPHGKVIPDHFNEMILSYTLVKEGEGWKAAQIDAHNVEKMDLPFSSEQQKQ